MPLNSFFLKRVQLVVEFTIFAACFDGNTLKTECISEFIYIILK